MTSVLDSRPPGLDAWFRPGNSFSYELTWPAGELDSRTFTATLDDTALTVTVDGDTMTISATEAQTAALGAGRHDFTLTDTTGGIDQDLIIGVWVGASTASTSATGSVTVTSSAASVSVSVTGIDAAERALARLEAQGAAIDQTAALALEERWLDFIRDAGSGSPSHPTFTYLGGDVTDAIVTGGGTPVWIGADWFAGTTVDGDDTYAGLALPFRNGIVLEATPGTFTSQIHEGGANTGVWINAETQGGLAAGTLWWPIAGLDDGGTMRVLCYHVQNGIGPYGQLLDSHIVNINAFGGYASHVETGLGALTDAFWTDGVLRDDTYTYIFGAEFVPDFDADVDNDGSVPNYGRGDDITSHHTLKRVARVPNGQLTTVASWEFWNGSTWGSDVTAAAPLEDTNGNQLRGDMGIQKIATGHYLCAAHQFIDSHLSVYRASAPQGPWELICRVPTPTQGRTINGGIQIGQLAKIIPTAMHPSGTPAEHSIVVISRNLLDPTDSFADRNIRRYAPQFAVIPNY